MKMAHHILCLLSLAALLTPTDCPASGQLNIPVVIRGLPLTSHNAGFECYVYDAAGNKLGSGGYFFFGIAEGTLETTVAVVIRRDNAAAGAPNNYSCGFIIYGGTEGERGTVGHGGTTLPMGFNIAAGGVRVGQSLRGQPLHGRNLYMSGLAWGLPGNPPLEEVPVALLPRKGATMNLFVRGYLPARFIQSLASVETRPGSICPCGCDQGGEDGAACTRDAVPSLLPEVDPPGGRRVATAPAELPLAKHRSSRIKPLSESLGLETATPARLTGTAGFVPQLTTDTVVYTGTARLVPVPRP